ncbi:uncharacterized protein N7477_003788 [Penicillium maclennaniae]|uniref:uncharacterized protein n=1 Tax=Penicillium maclennaniae TaxID=1343394 RepID=UPI002541E822|nr:uncharacterized protein N7477_003788 [Penicillium maclennaniae]KAJ5678155.1 hypothetical protein N7477_003788 [Penicillium maclennaniae]
MVGETGPIHVSRAIAMVMAGLFALSCYNVLEITISIFATFRRRSGLYFWSMVITTFGILLHAISSFLRYFDLAPNFAMAVLVILGWYAMVTGQSVVLYSRLHLVTTHARYSRWVLYMIIFNVFALHIPTTILWLGSNHGVAKFVVPFNIYERVQLTGFSVQETIISGLYIWETMTGLRSLWAMKGPTGQRVIVNIVLINIIAVLLDGSLLATEYTGNFDIQTTYKPFVYSIKLKMEFTVLNSLLAVVRTNPSTIEDIQSLRRDDLHIEPKWSGDRSDRAATVNTALGVDDQSHRRKADKASSTQTHHSWLSGSHRIESA